MSLSWILLLNEYSWNENENFEDIIGDYGSEASMVTGVVEC